MSLTQLKRIAGIFIPRVVSVRRQPGQYPMRIATPEDDLIEKAMAYWENDQYIKQKRFKYLKWLGFTLIKWPYYETIVGNYFKPANDLVTVIKELQSLAVVPPLGEESNVFEPGCNVGRNLFWMQKEYGCKVTGLDISKEAIQIAENQIWRKRRNYQFFVANALTTALFTKFRDDFFELTITRWHLIHIPLSDAKRRYVGALKRISKALVIFEPVREGVKEIQLCQDGRYCLSWDDWAGEYDMIEYNSPAVSMLEGGSTKVFYYSSEVDKQSTAGQQ